MRSRRIHILCIVIVVLMSLGASAQHSNLMSQYMFNGLVINPAYTGSKNTMAVNINFRNQWTGFAGAPTSQIASFHTPLKNKSPMSLGALLTREEAGVNTDISLKGVASYKMKMDDGDLRFGLGIGIGSTNSRLSEVIIEESGDPLFQSDVSGVIRPLFSAGAYYSTSSWYMGYSMPSIMRYEFISQDQIKSIFSMARIEHIVTGGYAYKYNRKVVIKPSFLMRTIPTSAVQFDINTNVIFNNKLWTGISYRHKESVIAMIEYQVHHQTRVGYSYDFSIGPIGNYNAGSHELMIIWVLRKQSFARNPRYF